MKILHTSDTHGGMPALQADGDIIVHSGDMMPNRSFGIREIENAFQGYWVHDNVERMKAWIGERPFLYTPGNHDYVDPTPVMRDAGIDARLLCNGSLTIEGVRFYGSPWTPEFYGWNWMCADAAEMRDNLQSAVDGFEEGTIDVFVCHGPMFGVLDRNASGERCGSKVLREVMQSAEHPPKLFLHGHIHEACGVQGWSRGVIVSNAACSQRVLTVQ